YLRAGFVRSRNEQALSELHQLIDVGVSIKYVQHHFWQKIFDVIGMSYKAYDDALAAALQIPQNFDYISKPLFRVDLEALGKIPEAAAEITRKEAYLAYLVQDLSKDENRFKEEADAILSSSRLQPRDRIKADDEIRAAYDRTLSKW